MRAATQDYLVRRRRAEHGDANRELVIRARRVATDDGDSVPIGNRAHPSVERAEEFHRAVDRSRDGHDSGLGCGAHGGDVAQTNGECLVPESFGIGGVREKVNALDERVRGDDLHAAVRERQHRAVIADAGEDARIIGCEQVAQAVDEAELTDFVE